MCDSERESEPVFVCVSVGEREGETFCVCVCVFKRDGGGTV